MALYTGEAVRIRAELIDPDTQGPLTIADGEPLPTAKIQLWAPGRNPVKNPSIRSGPVGSETGPDHEGEMEDFREETGDFIVFVHTRGPGIDRVVDPPDASDKWEAGKWTFRVVVTGASFDNWEYGSFTLKP